MAGKNSKTLVSRQYENLSLKESNLRKVAYIMPK